MNGISTPIKTSPQTKYPNAGYNSQSDLVDFILGITFEIWEEGQVELIHAYYAENVEVFALDGMTTSATKMVDNTYKTLKTFPDRLLLADDVITTGTSSAGFSSHRLISPMTNKGESAFGPATGKQIFAMNIADCEVNDGLITREWLVRDNLAVTKQLGFDPIDSATLLKSGLEERQKAWLDSEYNRTVKQHKTTPEPESSELKSLAEKILTSCWVTGDADVLEKYHAPYCVLHRAPMQKYSGRNAVLDHYAQWRKIFPNASLCVDHICSQPLDEHNQRVAVRWSVAARHEGSYCNRPASGNQVYILGVTHWQIVDGRIAAEWTVFDELAVLAQTL